MRILFVAISVPFPTNIGQRMRNACLVRALRMEGHEVTLIAFGEPGDGEDIQVDQGWIGDNISVISGPRTHRHGGAYGRLCAVAAGLPYGAWRMRSDAMMKAVRRRLESADVDLIVCDDIYQMANMPVGCPIPLVLNKPSVVHEEIEGFLRYEWNPFVYAYGQWERRCVRRLEIKSCGIADAVWTCSEKDRRILNDNSSSVPFCVVPNVVDVDTYRPAEGDDGQTVLFVGAMDWLPNRDAVEWFVRKVMPQLRHLAPKAHFVVAGREPSPKFLRRFDGMSDVVFTGTLPNLRPLIAQAAVCVVPLRIGSGTRLKILEAGAMSKAIVSTTIGAEGLTLEDGRDILIADEPARLAQAVADLLKNPHGRRELGRAARTRVVTEYSLPALRRSLHDALFALRERYQSHRAA